MSLVTQVASATTSTVVPALYSSIGENNEPSSILPVVPSIKTRQEDEVSLPLSKLLLARTDDDYHGGLTLQFGKTTVDDSDSDSENSDREDAKKKKKKAMAKKTGNKKKTNAVKSNAKKGDAEKERIEQEKAEKERLERERLEKEKLEKERLEKERLEKERLEKEELRKEKIKNDKLELLKELIKHKKHNKRDIISLDLDPEVKANLLNILKDSEKEEEAKAAKEKVQNEKRGIVLIDLDPEIEANVLNFGHLLQKQHEEEELEKKLKQKVEEDHLRAEAKNVCSLNFGKCSNPKLRHRATMRGGGSRPRTHSFWPEDNTKFQQGKGTSIGPVASQLCGKLHTICNAPIRTVTACHEASEYAEYFEGEVAAEAFNRYLGFPSEGTRCSKSSEQSTTEKLETVLDNHETNIRKIIQAITVPPHAAPTLELLREPAPVSLSASLDVDVELQAAAALSPPKPTVVTAVQKVEAASFLPVSMTETIGKQATPSLPSSPVVSVGSAREKILLAPSLLSNEVIKSLTATVSSSLISTTDIAVVQAIPIPSSLTSPSVSTALPVVEEVTGSAPSLTEPSAAIVVEQTVAAPSLSPPPAVPTAQISVAQAIAVPQPPPPPSPSAHVTAEQEVALAPPPPPSPSAHVSAEQEVAFAPPPPPSPSAKVTAEKEVALAPPPLPSSSTHVAVGQEAAASLPSVSPVPTTSIVIEEEIAASSPSPLPSGPSTVIATAQPVAATPFGLAPLLSASPTTEEVTVMTPLPTTLITTTVASADPGTVQIVEVVDLATQADASNTTTIADVTTVFVHKAANTQINQLTLPTTLATETTCTDCFLTIVIPY